MKMAGYEPDYEEKSQQWASCTSSQVV